jgi:hypothetical protein
LVWLVYSLNQENSFTTRRLPHTPGMAHDQNNFLPRIHPKVSSTPPQRIVKVNSCQSLRPYCLVTTKQYQNKINRSMNNNCGGSEYQTEYEKEKKENEERKKKFLAGQFRGYSGVASTMAMRPVGLIRNGSKYLSPLQPHPKDQNTPLYGLWHQPT